MAGGTKAMASKQFIGQVLEGPKEDRAVKLKSYFSQASFVDGFSKTLPHMITSKPLQNTDGNKKSKDGAKKSADKSDAVSLHGHHKLLLLSAITSKLVALL